MDSELAMLSFQSTKNIANKTKSKKKKSFKRPFNKFPQWQLATGNSFAIYNNEKKPQHDTKSKSISIRMTFTICALKKCGAKHVCLCIYEEMIIFFLIADSTLRLIEHKMNVINAKWRKNNAKNNVKALNALNNERQLGVLCNSACDSHNSLPQTFFFC